MKRLLLHLFFCLLVLSDYRCNTCVLADERYFGKQEFREIRTSEFGFLRWGRR